MPNSVRQPTGAEVDEFWKFALKFPKGAGSAFQNGIGPNFQQISNPHQPGNLYCLTCTAGNGGNDNQTRTLNRNSIQGKDVFVPVFVSIGENANDANSDLGNNPNVIFEIEDNSGQVENPDTFRINRDSTNVDIRPNNEFDLPQGNNRPVFTRNVCAVIPSNKIANIRRITFGGSGGRISPQNPNQFNTRVTYQIS
jgi:hypothetical protein